MAKNTVIVSVLADAKNFSKGFDDAAKSAGGLGGIVKGVGVAAGAALVAAAAGATAVIASAIKAAGESEKVAAQTAAVVKSTGAAAGQSVEQIGALATKLSRLSGVDDEVVQSGENILLTFTNIKGTTFDAATKSALDMSVAMGTDLNSAALQVGKALNDPVAGMSKLSKVGVTFTQAQKDAAASMVATGDVAGAQAIILGELTKEFGGSAEAFGNTFEGSLGKARTSLGNLQEALGAAFLPIATTVLSKVAGLLDRVGDSPAFAAALTAVTGFISGLLSGDSAIGGFIAKAVDLASNLSPVGLVLKALAPILPGLAGAFGQLASTLGGALAQVLPTITNLSQTLVSVLSGVFASVLPVIVGLIGQLAGVFTALMPAILPIVQTLGGILTAVIKALGPIITTIATTLGGVLGSVLKAITPVLVLVAQVFGQILKALAPVIPPILSLIQAVLALVAPILTLIGSALGPVIELLVTLLKPILSLIAPLVKLLAPAIQFVADALSVVIDWIAKGITWFVALVTGSKTASAQFTAAFNGVGKFFGDLWNGVISFFANGIANIVGFFTGLPGKIGSAISGLAGMLGSVGRNMIQGLINGASSMLGSLSSFVSGLVSKYIVNPVKSLLGIHSPSTVFRDIGGYTLQGLQIGLSDTEGVRGAIDSLGRELADTTLPAPRVSSATVRPSQQAASDASSAAIVSQMTAADRAFFRELFAEFAGSLAVTDGVIASAASAAQARLVKAGAR
ncbi:phage tail length tape measure family protein [Pseudolysinimonas kribbensis]|uniref:Membrane protein n=1 Tax=Pseudolysinimonas kribbensis TaxID=433641 RepID=A0ABQ6JZS8_9MICO|nr:hypothetical protein [Pseudolysinimonas kribbensis]GMA93836.1 membrane protein [Pseudolysinimonas kribbensis]